MVLIEIPPNTLHSLTFVEVILTPNKTQENFFHFFNDFFQKRLDKTKTMCYNIKVSAES